MLSKAIKNYGRAMPTLLFENNINKKYTNMFYATYILGITRIYLKICSIAINSVKIMFQKVDSLIEICYL